MAFKQEISGINPQHLKFIRMFREGQIKRVYISPPELVGEALQNNEVYAEAGISGIKESIDNLVVDLLDGENKITYVVKLEYCSSPSNVVRSMDLDIETSDASPVHVKIRISSKSLT